MKERELAGRIAALEELQSENRCHSDFLLTWDKSARELKSILTIADILRELRGAGISPRLFDSGLAVSQFRDNSTRTRFSFSTACNLLGLAVQDLDEGKSQIAHGETIRETSVMISFLTEVVGIRDDMYIGRGHTYMEEVASALEQGYSEGVLPQRPAVINLQCDIDHPTQSMTDLIHLVGHFGGIEQLAGKKVAMSWAYSPSYGKPLSVPQGIIGLLTRFGMDVRLAHPQGYGLMPDVVALAGKQASESGGSFGVFDSMEEAFEGADVVYPKSWAPFDVMEERTILVESPLVESPLVKGQLAESRESRLADLEERCLEKNREFIGWECSAEKMGLTDDALYLHCLPADITGVSCERGEVASDVFNRFRVPLYAQAGNKPFIIAAMILASRVKNPAAVLGQLLQNGSNRGLS